MQQFLWHHSALPLPRPKDAIQCRINLLLACANPNMAMV